MKKLFLSCVFVLSLAADATAQPTALLAVTDGGAAAFWADVTKAEGPLDSALGKTIVFGEGAPKAESGALFPGIPAKREVVVLGVCDAMNAKAWAKVLSALGLRGIEAKPARGAGPVCPVFDDARLKRITILRKPLLDGGMLTFIEAGGLLGGAGKKQAMALVTRENTLFDAWAPPAAPEDTDCSSFVDRRLGLVQVDCAAPVPGDNCFVTNRVGYQVAAVGMGLKAKASKPREIKRECAE